MFKRKQQVGRRVLAYAAAAVVLAAGTPTRAANRYWLGTFSGFWTNDFNWEVILPPGASDLAIFSDASDGTAVVRTGIILDANRTVASLQVYGNAPAIGPYSFTSNNNALLTVSGSSSIGFAGSATSTTTLNSFRLTTNSLFVGGPTTLVISGSSVITTTGGLSSNNNSVTNLTGGSLNLAASTSHSLNGSSTMNVNGGTLNLGADATFDVNASATLNFASSYSVTNNTLLRAQGGGDIVSASFIDVGNGGLGFLTVNQAGSTLTSQAGTSDWGRNSGANAVVEIFTGGTASVSTLRVGTNNASATLNVAGGTLNVGGTLTVGGGAQARSLQVNLSNAGTMNVTGIATFDNQADINLGAGTLNFDQNATFNAGSRLDITGGTLDFTGRTLTINGGTLARTVASGTALNSGSALVVQSAGTATFADYLDVGNGNSASLTVSGVGSTFTAGGLSDWGRGPAGGAVVSIQSSGVANLNSLRIGTDNGSASVTVATGAQLNPNTLTVGGGATNRTVNLTINGGTLTINDAASTASFNDKSVLNLQAGTFDPKGSVTFFTGSTANWSGGTFLVPSGKLLTVSGGVIDRTITTAGGLSPGATLAINAAGKFDSTGSYSVGELGSGTVTVDGASSRLWIKNNLALGGTTTGQVGTVTTTNTGRVFVGDAAGEVGFGVAVADGDPIGSNGGVLTIANGSTLTSPDGAIIGAFSTPGATKSGRVVVTGANSLWNSTSSNVVVGFNGTGELNVSAGGRVVTAANLQVSLFGGSGAVNVTSGGRIETTFQFGLFGQTGTTTSATVSGTNSTLAVGTTLVVGSTGPATLNVSQGGTVTSLDAFAGVNAGSQGTLTIDGSNSMLKASNDALLDRGSTLSVLNNGTFAVGDASGLSFNSIFISDNDPFIADAGGLFTVSGGSSATTNGLLFLSRGDTTSGRLLLTGANSTVTVQSVFTAERGRGDLRVEAGGKFIATDQFQVGSEANAIGTATVTGAGSSATAAFMTVGLFSNGTLDITAGGQATATIATTLGRFAAGVGTINVSGTGSTLAAGNTLRIGQDGTGRLNLNAGAKVTANALIINTTSRLDITETGLLELNTASNNLSTLRGYLLTGYNGGDWQGVGIMSSQAQVNGALGVGYFNDGAKITLKLTLKGDANVTGNVNFNDLLALAQNYNGTGKHWFQGDFDYNGLVNFNDLLALAKNYNQSLSVAEADAVVNAGGTGFAADWSLARSLVPEPTSLSLLVGAGALLGRRRRG